MRLDAENRSGPPLSATAAQREFEVRFGVIMLMNYYFDQSNIDHSLNIISKVDTRRAYYIMMSVAWAVATVFVKQRDKTFDLLLSKRLDREVQNKAISKIRDWFRVSKQDKDLVVGYKIEGV